MNIIDEIQINNNWRELDFAKFKIIHSTLNSDLQPLFLRMCIPMIYAHWEGFVVSSLKTVIETLNKKELKHDEVKVNIFVLAIQEKFNYLKGKQSFVQKCQFSENFISRLENKLSFNKKIDTKSNLNFTVLQELCEIFGFSINEFNEYELELNKLVNIRNSIAHGENSYVIQLENIEKYIMLITNLIFTFENEIDKFIKEKKYSKTNEIIEI